VGNIDMPVEKGDWIVRNPDGKIRQILKDAEFKREYETVDGVLEASTG